MKQILFFIILISIPQIVVSQSIIPVHFELKADSVRIDIQSVKDRGDKGYSESAGDFSLLVNLEEKKISFTSEKVVLSTSEIINYLEINDTPIFIYESTPSSNTLIISKDYYYIISDDLTVRYKIINN